MTIWVPDLTPFDGPRYLAIAEAISDAIDREELAAGAKLPPQRDLAWRLGVTVGTVGRGYMVAEQRGLVSAEVGRGTYVRSRDMSIDPDDARTAAGSSGAATGTGPASLRTPAAGVSVPRKTAGALLPREAGNGVDLSVNMAVNPWQEEAFARTLVEVAGDAHIGDMVRYMPSAGHIRHRRAVAGWLGRRGVVADADQIVLTCGAQHGLAIATAVLTQPGDPIMIEALTYPGLLDTLRLLNRHPEPLPMDDQGVRPDALEKHARDSGARVMVIVPTLHNPTATIVPEARRREIVEIARRLDLVIVEDDVYGNTVADAPPTLQSMAPERTVYLSSASKCLAPGLRCGWIAAPQEWVGQMIGAVYATAVALPATHFELMHRWIADGTADDLVGRLRAELAARQEIAARVFDEFDIGTHPSSFHVLLHLPDGWRGGPFAEAASSRGIRVTPASAFAAPQIAAPRAVRVSLAAARNRVELEDSLIQLRDIARGGVGAARAII